MNIEIANRLHQLRKQQNLSQEELASRIGVSRQAISKWERAEASPDTDNLILLAKLYGVSMDELLKTDSYQIKDTDRVSLKKESYKYEGAALMNNNVQSVSRAVPPEQMRADDGEIYPQYNNTTSSSIPQGSPFAADYTGFNQSTGNTAGNNENPYANKGNSNTKSDPFQINMKDLGKNLENGLGHLESGLGHLGSGLEKAGKIIGENIDKAGKKIQDEIKKAEAGNNNPNLNPNPSQDNNYQYNYNYNYDYNKKTKHKKQPKPPKQKYKATLMDKLMPMIMIILFCLVVQYFPTFAILFLLYIPMHYTTKSAIRNKDPMIFCYPVLAVMIFFAFGEWAMQYTWPIFLTIPLYYTTIQAFRKRNPLIFCYPVLTAYIFCFFVAFSDRLAEYIWPIFITIPFYYIITSHIMSERKQKNQ